MRFKIYKPTEPHGRVDVNLNALPWVYDQDPSSGNCASMWVVPATEYETLPARLDEAEFRCEYWKERSDTARNYAKAMEAQVAQLTAERDGWKSAADLHALAGTHSEKQLDTARAQVATLQSLLKSFREDVLFRIGSASPYRDVAAAYQERIKEALAATEEKKHESK